MSYCSGSLTRMVWRFDLLAVLEQDDLAGVVDGRARGRVVLVGEVDQLDGQARFPGDRESGALGDRELRVAIAEQRPGDGAHQDDHDGEVGDQARPGCPAVAVRVDVDRAVVGGEGAVAPALEHALHDRLRLGRRVPDDDGLVLRGVLEERRAHVNARLGGRPPDARDPVDGAGDQADRQPRHQDAEQERVEDLEQLEGVQDPGPAAVLRPDLVQPAGLRGRVVDDARRRLDHERADDAQRGDGQHQDHGHAHRGQEVPQAFQHPVDAIHECGAGRRGSRGAGRRKRPGLDLLGHVRLPPQRPKGDPRVARRPSMLVSISTPTATSRKPVTMDTAWWWRPTTVSRVATQDAPRATARNGMASPAA